MRILHCHTLDYSRLTPRSNSYFRDPRIRRVLIRYKLVSVCYFFVLLVLKMNFLTTDFKIDTYGNILRPRSTGASRSLPPKPPRHDRSNAVHR